MTDKEKAIDLTSKSFVLAKDAIEWFLNIYKNSRMCEIHTFYNGVLEGLSEGRKHAIEWHDLRKDPNDLPKETKDYIIYHEDNTGFHHYSIRRFSHNYFDCTNTVLAWCEQPLFKEKRNDRF